MPHRYQELGTSPDRKQWYALYFAAAEAVAQGCRVRVIETPRRYWLDVNGHLVQVRGRGSGTWQFGNWENPLADDTEYIVFADFLSEEPVYYIAPAGWFRAEVAAAKEAYLKVHDGVRPTNPESTHHQVTPERVEGWRDRWDLLT